MSAAAMPENAQTESVVPMMFDNFVLKRWLRSIGPVRRSEVLKKLKTDLENLGLSRKQVHRGLMQLATKPHVVLTRQPLYRKCGLKNLENERENKIVDNYRMIDVQKLKNIEWIVEQKDKHIKRTNSVKAYEDSLIKNNRQLFIDGCKVEIPLTTFHSFDKALEQFDKLVSSKMNMHEKLSNRDRKSVV